jgi:hypothetical protein
LIQEELVSQELRVPDSWLKQAAAREIVRIWANGDAQNFVLRIDVWRDPAAWGLLLVDLARHIAKAYAQKYGGSVDEVLARVKEGIDAEFSSPSE